MRIDQAARQDCGQDFRVVLAVTASGEPAGCTVVMVNQHRPEYSWQWNTVVLPAFRRRGIGRWIKAEMWRQLREAEPRVKILRTGNAESNSGMLAINNAMGFRPSHLMGGWQADIDVIEAGLKLETGR